MKIKNILKNIVALLRSTVTRFDLFSQKKFNLLTKENLLSQHFLEDLFRLSFLQLLEFIQFSYCRS